MGASIQANQLRAFSGFRCGGVDSQVQTKYESMEDKKLLSVFWKLLLYWGLDVKPSPGWSKKGKISSEWQLVDAKASDDLLRRRNQALPPDRAVSPAFATLQVLDSGIDESTTCTRMWNIQVCFSKQKQPMSKPNIGPALGAPFARC